MSLNLVSLSSGSRGNCIVVFSDTTSVIIDAGISMTAIKKGLKHLGCPSPSVLITHSHNDHIQGLENFSKAFRPDVYCYSASYCSVDSKMQAGKLIGFDGDFYVGDLTISPFRVSHDVPCVGYSIYKAGKKISVVTDLGKLSRHILLALAGSDIVFLEANHDKKLLADNKRYPLALKQRILSEKGHLCNEEAATAAAILAENGTRQIILGHLSEENNKPELATSVVSKAMQHKGIIAGRDVFIDVAEYGKMTKIFSVA